MTSTAELEVALHCTGQDRRDHHGLKLTGGAPGIHLEFVGQREKPHSLGKQIIFIHRDRTLRLRIESYYVFVAGCPVMRRFVRATNQGRSAVGIEYLSSAMLHGLGRPGDGPLESKLRIHLARNTSRAEGQWQQYAPSQLGFSENGLSAAAINSMGNWSSVAYLPLGMIENVKAGITWFWQIEHNGSWHWELGSQGGDAYLYAGGPDEEHHQAWKNLRPGESYQSVPVAMGCVRGGFDEAIAALTRYRRLACRAPHLDNTRCPVIYNDYMHCLFADPTTAKERPLVKAAAKAGCEYYLIDAGWYAKRGEHWWPAVGAWQPSRERFGRDGLKGLLDHIRSRGMTPGLWVEIEAAGIHSPLRKKPDDWFFLRHGRRIIDHGRYQLDFRNPAVRAYADAVLDRLIDRYGAGYIKIDYNITFQAGTDRNADSPGQGLLEHGRAYLAWIEGVRHRHPRVVLENCGSGGMRMDYAMLASHQIQSSSDQTDYRKYPAILVGALAAVLPEQLAVWAYPLADGGPRQTSFNMVNAMVGRIYLSGRLNRLSSRSLRLAYEGVETYKRHIRPALPRSIPFFPLGMPRITDSVSPVAVGLRADKTSWLAVWRLAGKGTIAIPHSPSGLAVLLYPKSLGIALRRAKDSLQVEFPVPYMAAIIQCDEQGRE
ncbi:MAG: alpha-galactosidase [Verrucomicrobia bacterium]|nr:alpha-galactosidase [Verrucomicrobiota bacterium]